MIVLQSNIKIAQLKGKETQGRPFHGHLIEMLRGSNGDSSMEATEDDNKEDVSDDDIAEEILDSSMFSVGITK